MGDYGTINEETGELDWEGNIYSAHFRKQLESSEFKLDFDPSDEELQPQEEKGDERYIVNSWGVTTKDIKVTPEV